MSQGKFVVTRDSMLQQKVQPVTRIKEDYVVATWKESVAKQSFVSTIQGNTTMSQQRKILLRQQIHAIGRNSITTKKKSVTTEIENKYKKNVAT